MGKNFQMKNRTKGSDEDLFPITNASNAKVTPTNNVPKTATDAQKVFDAMGAMAFTDGNDLVHIVPVEENPELPETPISEIDDSVVSTVKGWSSAKIKACFEALGVRFDSDLNPHV